jgi:hypothetical protein
VNQFNQSMKSSELLLLVQPEATFSSANLIWPRAHRRTASIGKLRNGSAIEARCSNMVCDRPSECPTPVHPGNPTGEDMIVVSVFLQNEPSDAIQIRPVGPVSQQFSGLTGRELAGNKSWQHSDSF